jgi:hypothetical protein
MALTTIETGIPLVTEDTITVADDYVLFLDGSATGNANKEQFSDVMTLIAGTGLSASSGVLNVDASQGHITTVGALGAGSIGTGFGTINNAAAITGTVLTATTNFTLGDTVITDGVITDTSGLSIVANVSLADDKVITLGEAGKIDFGDEAPDDNEATGIVFSFLAGATLAIGDVVYMGVDGEVLKAQADAVGTSPAIGICVSAGTDGNACDVLVQGIMHDTSAFPTFSTLGVDVFVSAAAAGAITATAPTGTGHTVQKVGVALHADMIYFNFNTTEVLLA